MLNNNDKAPDKHKQAEEVLNMLAAQVLSPFASGITLIKEYLHTLHKQVKMLPGTDAAIVLQATVLLLEQNPEYLEGQSPDAVHNLAMEAQQRNLHGLALRILEVGRVIFTDNVDINCDLLQLYYSHYPDKYKAQEVWNTLQSIDPKVRDKEWRYWVYGSIYYYKIYNDIRTAKKLLRNGVGKVAPEDRHQVFTTLAIVYADWDPQPDLEKAIEVLKEGLGEGLELGYEVARKIGELKQRLAGRANSADERQRYLEEALDWLNTAEALFTNDTQHPVINIYKARVNVLMGLRRYGEAIDDIAAILAQDKDAIDKGSLRAQLRLACERNGELERCRTIQKQLLEQQQSEKDQTGTAQERAEKADSVGERGDNI